MPGNMFVIKLCKINLCKAKFDFVIHYLSLQGSLDKLPKCEPQ